MVFAASINIKKMSVSLRKKYLVLLIFNACLLCHTKLMAFDSEQDLLGINDNRGIYPDIKFGFRSYEYSAAKEKVFDVNFPTIKLGLLGEYRQLFAQAYYERSQGDGDGNVESIWDGSLGASGLGNLGPAVDYTRSDFAALGGIRIKNVQSWGENIEIGLFGGYKRGSSLIQFKEFYSTTQGETVKYRYNIDTEGPFLGIGYAVIVGKYGLLGARGVYSWLDVDLTERSQRSDRYSNSKYTGTGKGLSFGVAWVASLTQSIQYTLEIDWHDYSYKDLESSTQTLVEIDETQISWRVGLTYLLR
ncbi:MAG: hypothetical protein AB2689_06000 [Candidatus Thiodiazotropha taylori]